MRILLLSYIIESVIFVLFRTIVYDDGTYLYAARQLFEGKTPYIDFPYAQGPVLIYVYGAINQIFGYDLYVSRIWSHLFGLFILLLVVATARRLAGDDAGLIAGGLLCCSPYTISHYTVPETYAIGGLFLVLSVYVLSTSLPWALRLSLAMVSACLAAGVRISLAPVVVMVFLYGLVASQWRVRVAVAAFMSGIAVVSVVFLPYVLRDKELFLYHILGLHLSSGLTPYRIFKFVYVLTENILNFSILLLPFMGVVLVGLFHLSGAREARAAFTQKYGLHSLIVLIVLVMFVVNFLPGGSGIIGSYYNNLTVPLVTIIVGWALASSSFRKVVQRRNLYVSLICLLLVFNLLQQFNVVLNFGILKFTGVRPYFAKSVETIRQVSKQVKPILAGEDSVFTFSTYLPVQLGAKPLAGMEEGFASYALRKDWTKDKCLKYHVLNDEIVEGYLRARKAKVVALTRSELGMIGADRAGSPMNQALHENYRFLESFSMFGQFYEELYVFVRK